MIGLVMAGGRGTRMKKGDSSINHDNNNNNNNSSSSSKPEKLLYKYKKPLVAHVIEALEQSHCFEQIFVAVSPHSPKTKSYLQKNFCGGSSSSNNNNVCIIDTLGHGYSQDLGHALHIIHHRSSGSSSNTSPPHTNSKSVHTGVLVVPGDLPLLDAKLILDITTKYNSDNTLTSFVIRLSFLESLGFTSTDFVISCNTNNNANQLRCAYTGISMINLQKFVKYNPTESLPENYIILDNKNIALNINTTKDYDTLLQLFGTF